MFRSIRTRIVNGFGGNHVEYHTSSIATVVSVLFAGDSMLIRTTL